MPSISSSDEDSDAEEAASHVEPSDQPSSTSPAGANQNDSDDSSDGGEPGDGGEFQVSSGSEEEEDYEEDSQDEDELEREAAADKAEKKTKRAGGLSRKGIILLGGTSAVAPADVPGSDSEEEMDEGAGTRRIGNRTRSKRKSLSEIKAERAAAAKTAPTRKRLRQKKASTSSDEDEAEVVMDLTQHKPMVLRAANEASPGLVQVDVPGAISRYFQPHQREGVMFLYRCAVLEERGCILAHCMGLGKTLQVVSLIQALTLSWRAGERLRNPSKAQNSDSSSDDDVAPVASAPANFPADPCTAVKTVLVLAPTNVIENWRAEVVKWTKGDAHKAAGGAKETRGPNVFALNDSGSSTKRIKELEVS
jgi:SNF2 family DNA or RNA helicase